MKIAIGNDHAGIRLKPVLVDYLTKNGYEFKDFGTYTEQSCNYAEFGEKLPKRLQAASLIGEFLFAVLV